MTSDSKSSATLKKFLDDLHSNNTDEEIKIILSQLFKYVEEIKLHFDEQIAGIKFYMEKSLNELKKNFMREYANMNSTKDMLDILELYKNDDSQLREQLKDLQEILDGIVKVFKNLNQNKQNQSSMTPPNRSVHIDKILQRKISVKRHLFQ